MVGWRCQAIRHRSISHSTFSLLGWEKHKSVITLNFDEGDEEKEEEEQEVEEVVNGVGETEEGVIMGRDGGVWTSDGGSDSCAPSFATYSSGAFYSSSEANNESLVLSGFYNNDSGTYYCDSDSGVSSMYESIQRGGNQTDASSGTTSLIRQLSYLTFGETSLFQEAASLTVSTHNTWIPPFRFLSQCKMFKLT